MDLRRLRYHYLVILALRRARRRKVGRRWAVRPLNLTRDINGEFASLISDLRKDDDRFFSFFRMNQFRFDDLLRRITPLILHKNTHHSPIPPDHRLAITLRMLASGESQISMATRYRMGVSTVNTIFSETCQALWNCLHSEYVPFPTVDTFRNVAEEFWRMWNFPLCLGAIDGKHIRCKCPPNSGSLYYNYKGYFSILLMACVDANYRFLMVDVGAYGSQGDPGTFAHSMFGKAIMDSSLPVPPDAILPGTNILLPHVLIGDEAFQMRPNIMRPYSKAKLNDERRIFNYRLSRARRVVENAFGILASRWRILLHTIEAKPENVDHIIKACVALHNYLKCTDASAPPTCRYVPSNLVDYEDNTGVVHDGEWRENTPAAAIVSRSGRMGCSNMPAAGSEDVRKTFVRYFQTLEGRVPWQDTAALSC